MENGKQSAFTGIVNEAYQAGLTKREYFAGLAMQGLLSIFDEGKGIVPNLENTEYMARMAVLSSDALLKELEKE
jgi:hypothetical protein